jgi:hypothetical protein
MSSAISRDVVVGAAIGFAPPLDWSRAAEWSTTLTHGDLGPVRRVFRKRGAGGPDVVWNPSVAQISAPPLRALLEYWMTLRTDDALPAAGRIDPFGMRRALGYVMLVDAVERGHDFRYRLYGSSLASISGFDMTGRLLSTHASSDYIREFSLAVYRASMKRREPAFIEFAPAGTLVIAKWQRIALPLTDDSGAIVRFVSGAAPIDRNGQVISSRL